MYMYEVIARRLFKLYMFRYTYNLYLMSILNWMSEKF